MGFIDKLKKLCGTKSCAAIILSGGSGSRFSGDPSRPKQLTLLCGTPMIEYSIRAFERAEQISEIVVVSRKEDISVLGELTEKMRISKPIKVVSGGDTRQKSALCGFEAVSDKCAYVAIHDAARPLITPEDIDKIISVAYRCDSCIAASRSVDTPKIVSKSGKITEKAPDREKLWMAQTPQVFSTKHYRVAAYYAKELGFEATDDASLMEFAGFSTRVVETSAPNFKVTHPSDALLAEAIINDRRSKESK